MPANNTPVNKIIEKSFRGQSLQQADDPKPQEAQATALTPASPWNNRKSVSKDQCQRITLNEKIFQRRKGKISLNNNQMHLQTLIFAKESVTTDPGGWLSFCFRPL